MMEPMTMKASRDGSIWWWWQVVDTINNQIWARGEVGGACATKITMTITPGSKNHNNQPQAVGECEGNCRERRVIEVRVRGVGIGMREHWWWDELGKMVEVGGAQWSSRSLRLTRLPNNQLMMMMQKGRRLLPNNNEKERGRRRKGGQVYAKSKDDNIIAVTLPAPLHHNNQLMMVMQKGQRCWQRWWEGERE
jgi:hypothetical protein